MRRLFPLNLPISNRQSPKFSHLSLIHVLNRRLCCVSSSPVKAQGFDFSYSSDRFYRLLRVQNSVDFRQLFNSERPISRLDIAEDML
jgi:hypothetical protein